MYNREAFNPRCVSIPSKQTLYTVLPPSRWRKIKFGLRRNLHFYLPQWENLNGGTILLFKKCGEVSCALAWLFVLWTSHTVFLNAIIMVTLHYLSLSWLYLMLIFHLSWSYFNYCLATCVNTYILIIFIFSFREWKRLTV